MIFDRPLFTPNSSQKPTRVNSSKYEQGVVDDKNDVFKMMMKRPFMLIFNTNFGEKALSKK